VFAPPDYQPSFVGHFAFLLLLPKLPKQSGLVFGQRVPECFIINAGRSVHPLTVLDGSEVHIFAAQVFDQTCCVQTSNSTRSLLDRDCDSPSAAPVGHNLWQTDPRVRIACKTLLIARIVLRGSAR
jgi:hypothetical protein